VLVVPLDEALVVLGGPGRDYVMQSARRFRAAEGRIGSQRWVVLRPCFAHLRAGGHEVLEVLRDVLIVNVELLFKRVQFGLVEGFPPLALEDGILRLRGRPRARRRVVVGRRSGFFEGGWSGHLGCNVLWPDIAAGEGREAQGEACSQADDIAGLASATGNLAVSVSRVRDTCSHSSCFPQV